jgi:Uma2 family endonuclease
MNPEAIRPKHDMVSSMSAPLQSSWTQAEFFRWAGSREGRYEFDGFQPVDTTGGTVGHCIITRNISLALDRRLRGSLWRPLGPDVGLATIGAAIRYPDALVTCARLDTHALTVPGVVVVFEVLSPHTSRTDRIVKVREYAAVASIRRYVIVESTSVGLTVLERERPDEVWRVTTLTTDEILHMPEIDIEVPITEFYDGVDFPDEGVARA